MTTRLTAEELGINDREMEALLWVRDALDPTIDDIHLPKWMQFDMNHWGYLVPDRPLSAPVCGTACCIGGSMEMYLIGIHTKPEDYVVTRGDNMRFDNAFDRVSNHPTGSQALYSLFFRYEGGDLAQDRGGATIAIDRFLAGEIGDPWHSAEDD